MRKLGAGLGVAWAIFAVGAAAGAGEPPQALGEARVLSLDGAVREALERSPSLEAAQAAVRRARGAVDEARALRLPRLDGGARFTVQGPIPTFRFPAPAADPSDPPRQREVALGRSFSRHFSVGATVDADPFGRLRDYQSAAGDGVRAAQGGLYQARNELVYAVQAVFLQALRAQELVAVAREAVDAAAEQQRVAEANLRQGLVAEFDVLRAQVQVANNRQVLTTAEADHRRALSALGELLSVEREVRLQLTPLALPPEPDAVAAGAVREAVAGEALPGGGPLPADLDAALTEAFTRRPEVYQAEWNRRAARAVERAERKGNLPSLTLGAQFNVDPDQAGLAFEEKTYTLVANLTIPLWDAGIARARTRQARAEVDRAAAALRTARDAVAADVRRAHLGLEDAAGRRRSAAANTALGREALRVARVRYEAGLAPSVEVTDAQVAYTQARANEVNAAYDYLSALAALNRALGRYAAAAAAP